jgi:hypothetical protein
MKGSLRSRFGSLRSRFGSLRSRFGSLRSRFEVGGLKLAAGLRVFFLEPQTSNFKPRVKGSSC